MELAGMAPMEVNLVFIANWTEIKLFKSSVKVSALMDLLSDSQYCGALHLVPFTDGEIRAGCCE